LPDLIVVISEVGKTGVEATLCRS